MVFKGYERPRRRPFFLNKTTPPIAPIKKPIGQTKIAMKKNAIERISIIPKAERERTPCKMTLIKNPTEENPVKSKNIFSFPFTFDFKVKKINIAPNEKKRIERGKKGIARIPLASIGREIPNTNNNIGITKFVSRIKIKITINA